MPSITETGKTHKELNAYFEFNDVGYVPIRDFIHFYKYMRAAYVWCVDNIEIEVDIGSELSEIEIQETGIHNAHLLRENFARETEISRQKHIEWLAEKDLGDLEPVIVSMVMQSPIKLNIKGLLIPLVAAVVISGGEFKLNLSEPSVYVKCEGLATAAKEIMSAFGVEKQQSRKIVNEMVLIPKGEFLYGNDKVEEVIDYDYYIDKYPVTNQQYKEFIDETGYQVPVHWDKEHRKFPVGKENHPVVNVSFKDAEAYCRWRSEKEGREIRLPFEKEWEKAARGTDGRKYPWGDEFDPARCNSDESNINKTTEVDKFPDGKSCYGCYDMAGNVWEWTDSGYDKDLKFKVLRGGSWCSVSNKCRCAYRSSYGPDIRYYRIGFRCARTLTL